MNDKEMIRTFKGNLVDYISNLKETEEKYNQIQSNWNSLRKWLKEFKEYEKSEFQTNAEFYITVEEILDKMNELERKKYEMKKYRVVNIDGSFGLFLDEEYEGEDSIDVKEQIMEEIMDNIGNYLDIELEEIHDELEGNIEK